MDQVNKIIASILASEETNNVGPIEGGRSKKRSHKHRATPGHGGHRRGGLASRMARNRKGLSGGDEVLSGGSCVAEPLVAGAKHSHKSRGSHRKSRRGLRGGETIESTEAPEVPAPGLEGGMDGGKLAIKYQRQRRYSKRSGRKLNSALRMQKNRTMQEYAKLKAMYPNMPGNELLKMAMRRA